MPALFVTATGTEIGKTLITSALCYQAISLGYKVKAIKPVISGYSEDSENDIFTILEAQNLPMSEENINKTSLYRFKEPISPDLAAKREEKEIILDDLVDFCTKNVENTDFLLIEGIGGAMVPLNNKCTTLDLMETLTIPAIVVGGTYLGAISHMLTTVESLKSRNIDVAAIIVNESTDGQAALEDMLSVIEKHTNELVIPIQRIEQKEKKWQNVPDLVHHFIKQGINERKRYAN